jgi:hypothetical protein
MTPFAFFPQGNWGETKNKECSKFDRHTPLCVHLMNAAGSVVSPRLLSFSHPPYAVKGRLGEEWSIQTGGVSPGDGKPREIILCFLGGVTVAEAAACANYAKANAPLQVVVCGTGVITSQDFWGLVSPKCWLTGKESDKN